MNGHLDSSGNPDGAGSHHAAGQPIRPRRLSAIRRPSEIVLLAEEPVSTSDIAAGFSTYADDGRWLPPVNSITTRHKRRGNANFVDGHAEVVDNSFATNSAHFISTY